MEHSRNLPPLRAVAYYSDMEENGPRQLSLFDNPNFYESADVEFKSAKGGLPGSLWETYSAFANTDGGTIFLGVTEKSGNLEIHGVNNPDKTIDDIFSIVHSNKVSSNLLTGSDVEKLFILPDPNCCILSIAVRRSTRQQRPVYLNNDPLGQTYRRDHTGDYRCTPDEVRRMFADQSSEPADSRILQDFSFADINLLSLQQFRQRVASANPAHPWLLEDDIGLLRKLGGWRRDRSRGSDGLTVAGLLMFGNLDAIRSPEALPNFQLDYRERPADTTHERWTDRITLDGTWEGNLFQFYNRVLPRLAGTLKTPFQLDANLYRYDETTVVAALREALVNALIHADYSGQGGVVIDRFPNRIELSNPGILLVSHEQLLRGGVSECRNKSLQQMFQLMGAGDKAGSGLDKIRASWASARLRAPSLTETQRPDRVRLDLPMNSILPGEAIGQLAHHFGPMFNELAPDEIQILVMAYEEGPITNAKLQDVLTMHRTDLTKILQNLARGGFLERKGFGRWTTYELPTEVDREMVPVTPLTSLSHEGSNDGGYEGGDDGGYEGGSSEPAPLSKKYADPALWTKLLGIGQPARSRRALMTSELTEIVARLCGEAGWLTRDELGELVGRNPSNLRDRTLTSMVAEGRLTLKYETRSHPHQAYAVKHGHERTI